jgi:ABC-type transport system involved in Fe-S cluster assembly fused permease/ATPase subunit
MRSPLHANFFDQNALRYPQQAEIALYVQLFPHSGLPSKKAIAHRLSVICNGDRIYVLENGRIAQEGSFTQLAQQKGLFAQLIAR